MTPSLALKLSLIVLALILAVAASVEAVKSAEPPPYSEGWNFTGGNGYFTMEEFASDNPCVVAVYRWSNSQQAWSGRWLRGTPWYVNNMQDMRTRGDYGYAVLCVAPDDPRYGAPPPQVAGQ